MAKKTITQKVMEKIITAPRAKVDGRTMYVVAHKDILRLSKAEDSATRRLREKVQAYQEQNPYDERPVNLRGDRIVVSPQFISWLKTH